MNEVFVIRNQRGHYWGKGKEWVDGSEPRTVLRVKHRDEAINTLVELSAKEVELRGEILAAEVNAKGDPLVQPSQIPLPGVASDTDASSAPEAAADSAAETGAQIPATAPARA